MVAMSYAYAPYMSGGMPNRFKNVKLWLGSSVIENTGSKDLFIMRAITVRGSHLAEPVIAGLLSRADVFDAGLCT